MSAGFQKTKPPRLTRLQREARARDRAARAHLTKTCGRGYFTQIERVEAEIARLGHPTLAQRLASRRQELDEMTARIAAGGVA